MTLPNCFSPYFLPWDSSLDYVNTKVICLYFFLIISVCVGFPALLWALSVLYQHHKSRGPILSITIFLLLSDLLELILSPVLLAYMSKGRDEACMVFVLLLGARLCGHLLHQLVALESILTQKYSSHVHICSPPQSICLCFFVWLVAFWYQSFPSQIIYEINIVLGVLPVIVCAVTCILTCKASSDSNQPIVRKPGVLVLSLAMFTLIILYVPFFMNIFTGMPFMLDCLASIRLISEPILCVLICRENRLDQATQTEHTL